MKDILVCTTAITTERQGGCERRSRDIYSTLTPVKVKLFNWWGKDYILILRTW
jgi:hypothetical protein